MPRLVPLLHPAAVLRGRWNDEPAQITYLKRWAAIAKSNPLYTPQDINQLPPRSRIFPTPRQLDEFRLELLTLQEPCLSIDTEEAGVYLICVGLTQLDLATGEVGSSINVPIRLRGGRPAYPVQQQLLAIIILLDQMFSDPQVSKVFHNGVTHDIPVLQQLGFTINGPLYDTMILAHLCYPEFRKSLQFCATLHLGAGRWKHLVDTDDELEDK
jgi:hypothetical protein